MKKNDTPQQANELFNGETKGVYTVDEHGEYVMTQTAGWDPETIALTQALEEIDRLTEEARQRVVSGQSSPLDYHMYARRMDLPMLAKAVGKFQWQVKRHLKPAHFVKLNEQTLSLYAQVLDIEVDELVKLPDESK